MKISGLEFSKAGDKYLGRSYQEMDCQAFCGVPERSGGKQQLVSGVYETRLGREPGRVCEGVRERAEGRASFHSGSCRAEDAGEVPERRDRGRDAYGDCDRKRRRGDSFEPEPGRGGYE